MSDESPLAESRSRSAGVFGHLVGIVLALHADGHAAQRLPCPIAPPQGLHIALLGLAESHDGQGDKQ